MLINKFCTDIQKCYFFFEMGSQTTSGNLNHRVITCLFERRWDRTTLRHMGSSHFYITMSKNVSPWQLSRWQMSFFRLSIKKFSDTQSTKVHPWVERPEDMITWFSNFQRVPLLTLCTTTINRNTLESIIFFFSYFVNRIRLCNIINYYTIDFYTKIRLKILIKSTKIGTKF